MLFASLELRILEEVHESSLVFEDILAVQCLAGEDIMSVMLCSRIELEYHCSVLNYQLTAESAEFALSLCCAREDVEVIAVAVWACALLALPEVNLFLTRDHEMIVDDILSCLYEVACHFLCSFDLVVLHDDVLAP